MGEAKSGPAVHLAPRASEPDRDSTLSELEELLSRAALSMSAHSKHGQPRIGPQISNAQA